MKNKVNAEQLKNSIQLLESEQINKASILKEQYQRTFKNIKPANILKSTLNEVTSSPYFMNKVLSTAVGLISGYVSKKLIVGDSDSKIRRLLGTFFQLGVSNLIVKHPDAIKTAGQFIFQMIANKKKHKKSKQHISRNYKN
jgi:hypothetical protein